ncbi:hypothetical protein Q31b_49530 [Novipirellula aureliae]|uniref:Uncharacterized protein n=1 Tax=Novipirellula aureliae TaxID=2527966 RepID=A0A5C6DM01_9BACT|nr:hypothetical protein Q31b_49530 [Novipirellula aureliae]
MHERSAHCRANGVEVWGQVVVAPPPRDETETGFANPFAMVLAGPFAMGSLVDARWVGGINNTTIDGYR